MQVVTRRGRLVQQVEHVGSAHTDAELALLLAAAHERMSPGQDVLDLGDLPVVPARMDDVADWLRDPGQASTWHGSRDSEARNARRPPP